VGHIKADFTNPNSKTIATEFCGTSITSGGGANDDKFKDRLANNPHFVFADAERRGYGVVELTPKRMTSTLRVIDDVRLKQTQVSTLAVFNVESGSNTIQR
jgi:alkaline phosphatase D